MMRTAFALLCLLALLCTPAGAQQTTPAPEDVPAPVAGRLGLAGALCPDIARYLNVRAATAPSLSPDGTSVAYRTSVTGTPQVWVAETRAGGPSPRQITFGESVTFHEWSPAGDWIAYGVDRGGNEREGFYLISPDGTREQELLPPSEAFRQWGGFSRDGRLVAFAATEPGGDDFHIYVVNLKAEEIEPRKVYASGGGNFVAAWHPKGDGLILTKTRGEDANDVVYLDLLNDKVETLFRPDVAARYESFAWTPDGRGFYLASDQDRDFAGLAFYDMQTRRLQWVTTPERDVQAVSLSPDGRYVAWSENAEGFSELRIRDLQSANTISFGPPRTGDKSPVAFQVPDAGRPRAAAQPPAARAIDVNLDIHDTLPRGVVNSLEWAAGAPRLAVQLSGPQVPGDIWMFDAAGWPAARSRAQEARTQLEAVVRDAQKRLARVTESSLAGLDPQRFVAPEAVSFPSHDGEKIHGLLYLPPGASAQRRAPVVLNVHGGPTGQARPAFNAVHQYLIARGYSVLDLNFRGSTGFGKRFARLDNGRLRPNAVKDMGAAIDWLKDSRHPVDASKAAVMGGSYGGYMTYAALTLLPEKFAAGVSFVGVSNWVTALEGASPQLKASDRIEYGNIDDPADREFFKELSPLTNVGAVRAPVLVSHGANDPRDPVTESDQFVRAIRERGGEVEYLRWPDEGHSIRKLTNRVIAYRRVARFFERTLGGGTVACEAP